MMTDGKNWNILIGGPAAFRKKYGHCDVPKDWSPNLTGRVGKDTGP